MLLDRALFELIAALPQDVIANIGSIAIDGTSATALLADAHTGQVLAPAKLYNEAQGEAAVTAAKVQTCAHVHADSLEAVTGTT